MTGLPALVAGGLLSASLALGVLLAVAGVPWVKGVDLDSRIAPYLDRPPGPSRLLDPDPVRRPAVRVGPVVRRLGGWADRTLGGAESVRHRLQRAGLPVDVEGFRIQQVLWGAASGVLAGLLGSLLWWTRGASVPALVVLVLAAVLGGALLRDQLLTRSAVRRERRMMTEFPTVAELLALAVTAGEGTTQALERVARLTKGELASELDLCLGQARTGTPLHQALRDMGTRTGLSTVTRFVDGLVVAVERGTPLGEVLRAQAQDARESARQALIEEGGRREITMMVPVVFLVLPVTVLFAVYPGLSLLRISL